MKKILIYENEREYILGLYGIIHEDLRRPFQKLLECKFTTDGKYVIFEVIKNKKVYTSLNSIEQSIYHINNVRYGVTK